ncbi:hypothetical protein [Streptomyces sp. CB02009]|uniref:hypothetical protein n=1 Tax=Streptomyces sp. CB02009 TaxID=1703938 RepID=UPI0013016C31|nr:hypothetical protein [Streptomyces sp. CB02009]
MGDDDPVLEGTVLPGRVKELRSSEREGLNVNGGSFAEFERAGIALEAGEGLAVSLEGALAEHDAGGGAAVGKVGSDVVEKLIRGHGRILVRVGELVASVEGLRHKKFLAQHNSRQGALRTSCRRLVNHFAPHAAENE